MASCCNKESYKENNQTKLLSGYLAFSPPSKPLYEIIDTKNKEEKGNCYKIVDFIHKDFKNIKYPWIDMEAYRIEKCLNKKKIILLHIKNKVENPNKVTLIFSHGNTSDLGVIYPFLLDLCTQLKVSLLLFRLILCLMIIQDMVRVKAILRRMKFVQILSK